MDELFIYLGLSVFALLLFTFWFSRQGKSAEKKWLLAQLNDANEENQKQYIAAIQELNQQPNKGLTILLVSLLIIPATFVIDYLWIHDIPLKQRTSVTTANNAPDLDTAIKQLEQKLAENPDDVDGQLLYGRSMMSMQNYPAAVKAYHRANQLAPDSPDILTALAEAIAFNNNTGSFLGEPESYLKQALEIEPRYQKAMWLQGIVHYENQQFEAAESMWTELLTLVDAPNIRSTITQQINMARTALNKPVMDSSTNQTTQSPETVTYFIVVSADQSINAIDLPATSRLFIYAKEINGPPMPIAAVPISAPFNWPISVKVGDQQNLNPQRKLSTFDQVEFSAKLSLTGNATPAEDDIFSNTVTASQSNTTVQLTLNQ
ncbi:tetratricopeptide repeat protein [Marinicella litoralis]|uniref:Uncharacterized protein n=1 Tax=Marinicella litoralis TaxID=644220 RepID=A0A4R6XF80_9GAMM|nr:tetratricopeptide repeat protein [Marinicella litoralis]TDR16334.1 hypothetical protein C8D91_2861 [Marinicella litoralis]